tara:strand:- start:806 stop:1537 length:732 start_codon:yes stop_codon:yes gene_type:complete
MPPRRRKQLPQLPIIQEGSSQGRREAYTTGTTPAEREARKEKVERAKQVFKDRKEKKKGIRKIADDVRKKANRKISIIKESVKPKTASVVSKPLFEATRVHNPDVALPQMGTFKLPKPRTTPLIKKTATVKTIDLQKGIRRATNKPKVFKSVSSSKPKPLTVAQPKIKKGIVGRGGNKNIQSTKEMPTTPKPKAKIREASGTISKKIGSGKKVNPSSIGNKGKKKRIMGENTRPQGRGVKATY